MDVSYFAGTGPLPNGCSRFSWARLGSVYGGGGGGGGVSTLAAPTNSEG